jgi:hypothetical protein
VHHCVEGAGVFVDAAKHRLEYLAVVAEVDSHRRADGFARQHLVDIEHLIAIGHEVFQHRPAQLPAAARHQHIRHSSFSLPPYRRCLCRFGVTLARAARR